MRIVMRNTEDRPQGSWETLFCRGRIFALLAAAALLSSSLDLLAGGGSAAPALLGKYDTPGYAFSVKVSGHLAYVADGSSGLAIVDVEDPVKPTLIGAYAPSGTTMAVCVGGNVAYLACASLGVLAIDVSDPSRPVLIGSYATPGYARDVALDGSRLYVTTYTAGLLILDVSDPGQLKPLGTCALAGLARRLQVRDGLAYVVDEDFGLRIVDVHDPAKPFEVAALQTPGRAQCVQVVGSLAFVGGTQQGLTIVDVGQPTHPAGVGSLAGINDVYGVHSIDGIVFAANGVSGIRVIDVHNPGAPKDLLRSALGSSAEDLTVVGNAAYLANGENGLAILNLPVASTQSIVFPQMPDLYVTNRPVTLAATASSGLPVAYRVTRGPATVEGTTLTLQGVGNVTVVADQPGSQGYYPAPSVTNSFNVLPVMSVAEALDAPGLSWVVAGSAPWFAQTEVTHDNKAALASGYLASSQHSAVQASVDGPGLVSFWWKVSSEPNTDTLQFQIDGTVIATISGEKDWANVTREIAAGRHILRWSYAKDVRGSGGLDRAWLDQVVYINPDSAPQITAQPSGGQVPGGAAALLKVTAAGFNLRYQWYHDQQTVEGATNDTLQIVPFLPADAGTYTVTVANPKTTIRSMPAPLTLRPRISGALTSVWRDGSGGEAQGISIQDARLCLADGPAGMRVFDISEPDSPRLLGSSGTQGSAHAVTTVGDLAFVAARKAGLEIVDISTPAQPTRIGSVLLDDEAFSVAVQDHWAFLATRTGGVQIVDVADPRHPVRVAAYNSLRETYDVVLASGKAFVADAEAGLEILDIANPTAPTRAGGFKVVGIPASVRVFQDIAYVAAGPAGVQVLKLKPQGDPSWLGAVETPGFAYAAELVGNLTYIPCDGAGVRIVDATAPLAQMDLGGLSTGGRAYAVRVAADHAYVADGVRGLLCYALTEPSPQTITASSIPSQPVTARAVNLNDFARTTSDLPISYRVLGGPARVQDAQLELLGLGPVTVLVEQAGDDAYYPAKPQILRFDVLAGMPLSSALGAPAITWETSQPGAWYGQTRTSYDGVSAAASGMIGDSGQSVLTGRIQGPGELGFRWKVSSEYAGDVLSFAVDGQAQKSISGERDWAYVSTFVDIGYHTLTWTYAKNTFGSVGSDTAWLDQVAFSGTNDAPIITVQPQDLRVAGGNTGSLTVNAIGLGRQYQWYQNGHILPGATGSVLTFYEVTHENAGTYTVIVTNQRGQAVSASTEVTWVPRLNLVPKEHAPVPPWAGGTARSISVNGRIAYVADGDAGLQVLDVANPAEPRRLGWVKTVGATLGVVVNGSLAYVAVDDAGLQIIDVSNPEKPAPVASIKLPGRAKCVRVVGNIAYIAANEAGLHMVDISHPETPVLIATSPRLDLSGYAVDVCVSSNIAYVAETSCLRLVDIRDPANPIRLGNFHPSAGRVLGVSVAGSMAYVAAGPGGLLILDASDPTFSTRPIAFQTPGQANAITVVDGRAYVAQGQAGLAIVDVSRPSSPSLLEAHALPLEGFAYGLQVQDGVAYVACGATGLKTIRPTGTMHTYEISSVGTWTNTRDVRVAGGLAYVAVGTGMRVYAVGMPDHPQLLGACSTPGVALSLDIAGDRAYVADSSGNIVVMDISNPAIPRVTGYYGFGASIYQVQIVNKLAFVAGATGFSILSLDSKDAPVQISRTYMGAGANGLRVGGDIAYIATDSGSLAIYNVANPARPVSLRRYSFPSGGNILDVDVRENFAFVAAGSLGVYALDVSDPGNPVLVGKLSLGATARQIRITGNYASVADYAAMDILDIRDPRALALALRIPSNASTFGAYLTHDVTYIADDTAGLRLLNIYLTSLDVANGTLDLHGNATSMQMAGRLAFIADGKAGLIVADINDPSHPALLGDIYDGGEVFDVKLDGNIAYLAEGTNGLHLIDTADPSHLNPIASYKPAGRVQAIDIDSQNHRAALAKGTAGIEVVGISDPLALTPVATFDTPGTANMVQWVGSRLYVADGGAGLLIVDASDQARPRLVGSLDTPGSAQSVRVRSNIAYIADGASGLQVVDVSNESKPSLMASVATGGFISSVELKEKWALLTDTTGWMHLFDLTDPTHPVFLSRARVTGTPSAATIASNLVYVSSGASGIMTFEVIEPGEQTILTPEIVGQVFTNRNLTLTATASSGLPVRYDLLSGPGLLSGNTVSFTGLGRIVIRASQSGDVIDYPATPMLITFDIIPDTGPQPVPTLGIQRKYYFPDPGIILSWPAASSAFRLEFSPGIEPADWKPVLPLPSINGDQLEVVLPLTTPPGFYRLHR